MSISPVSGGAMTVVTISGTNFGATRGYSYVRFGTARATSYDSWSSTQIKVKVPAGAAGAVKLLVITGGGKSNAATFKVKPRITYISPLSGAPGKQVTLTGTGFGTMSASSSSSSSSYVTFGDTKVTSYAFWSNTTIVCKVPATGTGAKLVKVTTSGGTSNGVSFTVR